MTSGKYFNRAVMALDSPHIGHVVVETDDKIVVFGDRDYRYDIPKAKIIAVGRNVIVDMDFPEIFDYKIDRNAPMPTG
jgi:sporulation protein YlmC with PRC-barrel domain